MADETVERHISVRERRDAQRAAAALPKSAKVAKVSVKAEAKVAAKPKVVSAEETPDRLKPPFPKVGTDGKPITNV